MPVPIHRYSDLTGPGWDPEISIVKNPPFMTPVLSQGLEIITYPGRGRTGVIVGPVASHTGLGIWGRTPVSPHWQLTTFAKHLFIFLLFIDKSNFL